MTKLPNAVLNNKNNSHRQVLRMTLIFILCVSVLFTSITSNAAEFVRGIYLQQSTLENISRLKYFISQSQQVGINTFVIDINHPSKTYARNIQLVKRHGIRYVARVVIFPRGGTPAQVRSKHYWEKKYQLVKTAIAYGANEIQLDYIRYSTQQPARRQNAHDIHAVIKWFKQRLKQHHIPLQIDVFGETSFGQSKRIGQDLVLFAPSVDAICPMVYPSHYEPYQKHAKQPYETVYRSLVALKEQFDHRLSFRLYAYIEVSNYRYPLSPSQKIKYIQAQIKATNDAKADGWFAWSANNIYHHLFQALKDHQPGATNDTNTIGHFYHHLSMGWPLGTF